jgi:hypothetical protein
MLRRLPSGKIQRPLQLANRAENTPPLNNASQAPPSESRMAAPLFSESAHSARALFPGLSFGRGRRERLKVSSTLSAGGVVCLSCFDGGAKRSFGRQRHCQVQLGNEAMGRDARATVVATHATGGLLALCFMRGKVHADLRSVYRGGRTGYAVAHMPQ